MKSAVLVLCVTLGLILLTLKADAGRLISEEGHDRQAKQLQSDTDHLNNKAAFGGYNNDVKNSHSGDVEVASSEDGSGEQEGDDSHRYFPDIITHPKVKEPERRG